MIIIPAIDIIEGKCVRLTGGSYDAVSNYDINPVDQIEIYGEAGFSHVHVVDLDGARAKKMVNWSVIEKMLTNSDLTIDVSGGIKTADDVELVLNHRNAKVTIGSFAANQPDEYAQWLNKFGSDRIILGADIKDGKIAIHGWEEQTRFGYLEYIGAKFNEGQKFVMCTDISKDGMMLGPAINLYSTIIKEYPNIALIASGGVRSLDDLKELRNLGCYAAIVGKAIYEGAIKLKDLVNFNSNLEVC